jgi:hypothetical protein
MDFAGLSDERDAHSVAPHVSGGARDRRVRPGRGAAVRPTPGHARQQGTAPTLLSANRPTGAIDRATAAVDTADRRQADYFLRLLMQNRRLIDQRMDGYEKAIAVAEAKGDTESADVFRRTARVEEQERNALDALIENLNRRFPVLPEPEAPPISRGPRLVIR